MDNVSLSTSSSNLPVAPPIHCIAEPIEVPRARASAPVGKWVLIGFLLVLALKLIGVLIIALWLVRRIPKTVLVGVATLPFVGGLRKRLADLARD